MHKPDDFDLIPRNTQNVTPSPGTPAGGAGGPASPYTNPQGGPYGAPYGDPYGDPYAGPPAPDPEPPGRSWTWLITLGIVAFVAFAGGAALFTLRDRLGPAREPTPAPAATSQSELTPSGFLATLAALTTQTPPAETPASGTPQPLATVIAIASATARARGAATPSPMPTLGPTATPTPCPVAVAPALAPAWQQGVLGCPLAEPRIIWAAVEPFERGSMLWRSDTNRSYLFTNDARWEVINAAWDGSEPAGRGQPPAGLFAPDRGFGWAWSTQDTLFQRLGWATDIEKGFCADVQEFERGFLMQSSTVPSCTAENLYNQATAGDWRPLLLAAHEAGMWSGALGGSPVVAAAPTRTVSVASRPQANGIFSARSPATLTQPIVVDGSLDEWPADGWYTMVSPVEGNDRYDGTQDASGAFNLIWSSQGLMLGVRVVDERWRPGPVGTDLWQGDALELHMDTRLSDDYASTSADSDDFQIGIAPTGNGGALQAYRWLPLAIEGVLPAQGQAVPGPDGYTIEVLLPWTTFGFDSPQAGASYGFNLSISDNDSDTQSQESVISASPARTTFDNPTEWGTLVLMP